ncbi:hypothetical protein AB0C87_24945 [Actinomadura sp. NPDC048021]|uniref:hypothetical protein n=1 Tax=Actinomadura sp. NPDC048021 TaxID=3155385 RepID=UPI0033E90492
MDYAPMVTLEGVDGSQFALSAKGGTGNIWLNKGATGLDMPEWDVQTAEYPVLDGEYPIAVRGLAREIFLPLTVWGDSRPQMVANKRRLIRALPPNRMFARMAKLIVAEADESGNYEPQREIEVYYADGLQGDEGSDNGLSWGKYGLVLRAPDPFFRDRADTVISFAKTPTAPKPFFPPKGEAFVSKDGLTGGFKLSSDPVFSPEMTIHNPGEISVFPTWKIVGPLEGPFNLVREATSYSPQGVLVVNSMSLAVGEFVTIVTTPGKVKVTASNSSAGWSNLTTNPQFWALDPGDNQVSIQGLNPGQEPSFMSASFRVKYLGI